MTVNEKEINCMYVTRDENGSINLYGAYQKSDNSEIFVFNRTKNTPGIGQELYGEKYTNEYIAKSLKYQPNNNFIKNQAGPIGYCYDSSKVIFV